MPEASRLLVVTIVLVLSFSGFAAVFNGLGSDVTESAHAKPVEDLFDDDCVDLGDPSMMNTIDMDPFIQVVNVRGCDFITFRTGERYSGSWSDDTFVYEGYDGGDIDQIIEISDSQPIDHVEIFPLKNMTGPMLVPSNAIIVHGVGDAEYCQPAGMFRTYGTFSSSYSVMYHRQWWDTTDLIEMGTPQGVDAYTEVDAVTDGDRDWLVDLAMDVSGTGSMYDRLNNIVGYLHGECRVVNYYAPMGCDDQVRWFLEDGKRGDREMFDTAFTLMARAIGAPARICYGYELDVSKQIEEIRADEWTTRSEVLFNEYGWIPFDPVPVRVGGGEDTSTDRLYEVVGEIVEVGGRDGVASVPVQLEGEGVVEIAYTDEGGVYRFEGIEEGWYSITAIPPLGIEANSSYHVPVSESSPFVIGDHRIGIPSIGVRSFEFGGDETSTLLRYVPATVRRGEVFTVNGTYNDLNSYSEPSTVVIIATIDDVEYVIGASSVRNDFSILCSLGPSCPLGALTVRALSLGDEWNSPSQSDEHGPVMLMDGCTIDVIGPERVIPGVENEWVVSLTEDATHDAIANVLVDLGPDAYHTGWDGTFTFRETLDEGSHTFTASFPGTGVLTPNMLEWDVLAAPIELVLEPTSIPRNARSNVTGHLSSSGIDVVKEAVGIWVNGSYIGDSTTDGLGRFDFSHRLGDVPLTNLTITVSVLESTAEATLGIASITSLKCGSYDGKVWVRLMDDHDDPVGDEQVHLLINDTTYLMGLNEGGAAVFDVQAEDSEPIDVWFEGDSNHLASSNATSFVAFSETALPGWLPVAVIIASAIALAILTARRLIRHGPSRGSEDETSGPGPFTLTYDGSEEGVPLAWEVGELATITINGAEVERVTLDAQRLEVIRSTVEFEVPDGRHKLMVWGPDGVGTWIVTGSEYRDEIIKEYVRATDRIRSHVPRAGRSTTPMELVASVPASLGRDGLHRATIAYERAEYSEHSVDRGDYVTLMMGLGEVGV